MADADVHGPIDFVILEFTGDRMAGATAEALLDLVESGIIRVYDLLVIRKEADGTFSGMDINDLGFSGFSGARSGLLGDDDLEEAANALEPGTTAAVIVYENAWAIPFVSAALSEGGQLIAGARIPAQDVIDALDALDSA